MGTRVYPLLSGPKTLTPKLLAPSPFVCEDVLNCKLQALCYSIVETAAAAACVPQWQATCCPSSTRPPCRRPSQLAPFDLDIPRASIESPGFHLQFRLIQDRLWCVRRVLDLRCRHCMALRALEGRG